MLVYGNGLKRIQLQTRENVPSHMFAQRRLKSACAAAQFDQNCPCLHIQVLLRCPSKIRPVEIVIRMRKCAG